MATVEEKRQRRTAYLHLLYDAVNGSTEEVVDYDAPVREQVTWTDEETLDIVQYLADRNLIELVAFGPQISITPRGVDEVENARAHPTQSSSELAPINVVFIGGNVGGSQLVVGGSNVSQEQTVALGATERARLVSWLEQYSAALADLGQQDRAEAEAALDRVRAELGQKNPDVSRMRRGIRTLRDIAVSAAGSAAFQALNTSAGHLPF